MITKVIISVVVLFSRGESDSLFINGDICMVIQCLKLNNLWSWNYYS